MGDLRTGGKGAEGSGAQHGNPRATGNQQATSDKHAAFFAKEVAEYLKHNLEQGRADRFILVAEPRFLGALRDKLDHTTRDAVSREIDKDLTKQSADDSAKSWNCEAPTTLGGYSRHTAAGERPVVVNSVL